MYQPLALFIGLRYTRARRKNQFISVVSLVSLLGMILGVVALVVVMSVMNGFETELRNRILALVPHAYVTGPEQHVADWRALSDSLETLPFVRGTAPYIGGNVMLSRPGAVRGAELSAIDPDSETAVSAIGEHMQAGALADLQAGEFRILVGELLARFLGVYEGDKVSVTLPQVTVTPVGVFPRVKQFTVAGVFAVGADLDSTAVFIHLADGQKLFQYGAAVEGVRVQVDDMLRVAQYTPDLLAAAPAGSQVTTWAETQGSLFSAVAMEKTMVSLLLLIIIAIAAFNIISILTMMVADKRSDIAVLRTMGASPGDIQAIFIIQGMAVGLAGIVVGLAVGLPAAIYVGDIVAWFEHLVSTSMFNPQVYFISRIPSVVQWSDILTVTLCGVGLSFLATLYPARRAAQVQPAEALRYE